VFMFRQLYVMLSLSHLRQEVCDEIHVLSDAGIVPEPLHCPLC
jgi:hypothetical protein